MRRFWSICLVFLVCMTLLSACSVTRHKGPSRGKTYGGTFRPYSIRGKTYYPLRSAKGFSEEGIASWYGPGFHGRKTSSGEVYNQYDMTAAHTVLPMGTKVRVTNLENGRSVQVRINDRGPFHRGRIIDVSRAAAQRLGIIGKGSGRVRIKALSKR